MLIDIGANLTHESFQGDIESVLARAKESKVDQIIVTGTSVLSSIRAQQLTQKHNPLYSTAGIHPHHAEETSERTIADLEKILILPEVVAVGETGLDFFRDYTARDVQIFSFEKHIELATRLKLPMFLHEREAHKDFLQLLREYIHKIENVVVHCFTGDKTSLRNYLDLDCYIGITGWITDTKRGSHLHDILKYIPSDKFG